jgi:transmembrane sensor
MTTKETIAEQAVDWMVRLSADKPTEALIQAHAEWLQADEAHHVAWQTLQAQLAPTSKFLDPQYSRQHSIAARVALESPKRRRFLKHTALALSSVSVAYVTNRNLPLMETMADAYTATGERKTIQLTDGSAVMLNARSAIDIRYTSTQRTIVLQLGECIVDVKAETNRPFVVEISHGHVRALGTRFLVKQDAHRSFAHVIEHSVEVTTQYGLSQTLQPNQSIWFDSQMHYGVEYSSNAIAAWAKGILDIRDQTMAEVIQAIQPYRKGLIRLSPEVAQLRVYGVFHLDNTDHILQSLAEVFPIKLRSFSSWLVFIDKK